MRSKRALMKVSNGAILPTCTCALATSANPLEISLIASPAGTDTVEIERQSAGKIDSLDRDVVEFEVAHVRS